jgi:hypothetical protein
VTGKQWDVGVQGTLTRTQLLAIKGFHVSRFKDGVTHLVGWAGDQTRVHSILALLHDLSIDLVSFNPVA